MTNELTFIPLFSGSSGNAIFVGTRRTKLLIDAGLPGRTIECALGAWGISPSDLSAILITHEHADHIKGAGILARRHGVPIYANEKTWAAMYSKIGDIPERDVCVFSDSSFYIGDLAVETFRLPHDAADPCGYIINSGNKKAAVATDLGHCTKTVKQAISGCDLVLLESNHDLEMLKCSRYPAYLKARIGSSHGHLSNDAAAEMALELVSSGVKAIVLGHLSAENNEEDLAYRAVASRLKEGGAVPGKDISLALAYRDRCAGVFRIA